MFPLDGFPKTADISERSYCQAELYVEIEG